MVKTRRRVQGTDGLQGSADKSTMKPTERPSTAIHSLAPEILTEIFLHCLPKDLVQCSILNRTQAPLLLGRVCSRWRKVSISSAYLWSWFAIEDKHLSPIDCKKALEATKVWIPRSRSVPLSIHIEFIRSNSGSPLLPRILASIASQSWRWKYIATYLPPEFDGMVLAPLQTGHLPELENFLFSTVGSINRGDVAPLNFSSAPRLQEFFFDGGIGVPIDFGGGMHHIKFLEIGFLMDPGMPGLSLDDLLTCFTHCQMLEKLNVTIHKFCTGDPREPPTVIELSHLHHFTLELSPGVDAGYLFGVLFLPALTHLELIIEDVDHSYTDWPYLRSMLARSRPPLRFLTLYFLPINEQTLCECLSYIPSLNSIYLRGTTCSDTILGFLTLEGNASRRICPCLESITFGRASHFTSSAMIAMILLRQPSANHTDIGIGKALRSVDCASSGMGTIASNSDIAKCMEDGLRLYTGT